MKTEELINVLSTNIESVDVRRVTRTLRTAVMVSLILALIAATTALGIRWDVRDPSALGFLVLKVTFGVAVTILGSHYLFKHARQGGEKRSNLSSAAMPFVAVIALAGVTLMSAPPSHWDDEDG